ncbi:hypothetical protein VM1G_08464 [Cytospora mali]|uniref:C2H2-type domain-containing protein n=1 Tax=Cytospora mali TaxID=578113 RepID=A0A194W7S3_CYTMA|nr:hypothetical protein VM1G_08464 [Valsa mali]
MTSVGYPEFQTQSSPGFLPYPGYNFLGDFDNHDGSSSICSLPERPKVSIPQNGSLNQLQQTSPAGYSGLSASTAMFSASSANSEQTSWSIFDGSTACPESTSPCTQCSQENDMGHIPIYGSNQITPISPYTTIPDEMHPRYADFSQGKAVVDATGQDNFNMNSFHVGMDAYSPSSDATPDSRGPFEAQVSLFSSDVPDMISKDSLAASTSNLYENHLAFEVGCSPSTEYPAITGDITKALEDWPLGSANSISRTDLSRTGDELEKPRCEFEKCPFEPQGRVKDRKSFQKMRSAVQKHMKRFHNSEVYECPFCPAVIKKRPDNLKDHIRKKHPKRFSSQYPGHEAKHDPNQGLSYGTPQRLRKKRLRSA